MAIAIDTTGGVMTLRFDRPARKNAITGEMYTMLADALAHAERERAIRVVVIAGHANVFTAGNDLEDFMQSPPEGDDAPVFRFLHAISTFPKPIVAAVSGVAVGIGTTLLLHCDVVYASETARFSLPFVQLGLCPEAASSTLLATVVGPRKAAELLMFGEAFTADDALVMGLVNAIRPVDDLEQFVAARALRLAQLPGTSLRATKELMKASQAGAIARQIALEVEVFGRMLREPAAREAFAAFFEKRAPDFSSFD
jgi:enoyl-CoA hydratase/carnithine racemase